MAIESGVPLARLAARFHGSVLSWSGDVASLRRAFILGRLYPHAPELRQASAVRMGLHFSIALTARLDTIVAAGRGVPLARFVARPTLSEPLAYVDRQRLWEIKKRTNLFVRFFYGCFWGLIPIR